VAVVLALVGLARERSPVRWAYFGCLLFALEASRGFNGSIYPLLHRWVTPFRGLRVPARFDLLINLSLAVLAAYGAKWLFDRWPDTRWRFAISVAVLAAMMGEYASAPVLAMVPKPAQVDSWLARERPLVLLELPLPPDGDLGRSRDWLYMYQATVHWQEMLNGYSGFFPNSYGALILAMRSFPDDSSMAFVRGRSVDRIVLRGAEYTPQQLETLLMKVNARPDLAFVGAFPEGQGHDFVYRVEK
jgi:hypothetical protein